MVKTTTMLVGALIALLFWAVPVEAQLWAPVLDPTRAANWQGMIFSRPDTSAWTDCPGSPIPLGSTYVQVQAVHDGCGSATDAGGRKIRFLAGTYTLNGIVTFSKSNLLIQGAGANQTEIISNAAATNAAFTCQELAAFCIQSGGAGLGYPATNRSYTRTISSGATQGSTSIVVPGDTSTVRVNDIVYVRQNNENNATNYAPYLTCDWNTPGNLCLGDATHIVAQVNVVTAKSPSGCTTNCTITLAVPLHYVGWKASLAPELWSYWEQDGYASMNRATIRNVGIEDMKVTPTWTAYTSGGPTSYGFIQFTRVNGGWLKRVTSNGCDSACFSSHESINITAFSSYLFNSRGGSNHNVSSMYGLFADKSSNVSFYNNICQQIQACVVYSVQVHGSVIGYNFIRDNVAAHCTDPNIPQQCPPFPFDYPYNWGGIFPEHASGISSVLIEGNDVNKINVEDDHGAGCCMTIVRNFLTGYELNNGQIPYKYMNSISLNSASGRFSNVLGNVMGTVGIHNNYESSAGPHGTTGTSTCTATGCSDPGGSSIYHLGGPGDNGEVRSPTFTTGGYDPNVELSLYRWGNYDTVSGVIRWCGTSANSNWNKCNNTPEVPSGQTKPASETVPSSFVFASKPTWFPASVPWPPIGPGVSSGNVSGYAGLVNKIPARLCAESLGMPSNGTGSILNFNADCYGTSGSDTTAPAAPTGVTIQ